LFPPKCLPVEISRKGRGKGEKKKKEPGKGTQAYGKKRRPSKVSDKVIDDGKRQPGRIHGRENKGDPICIAVSRTALSRFPQRALDAGIEKGFDRGKEGRTCCRGKGVEVREKK